MAADAQLVYGGLTVGDNSPYDLVEIDGLDGFQVRSSDRLLPDGWGSIPGRDLVESKLVTFTVEMDPDDIPAFESAFVPRETLDASSALKWKFPHREELYALARVSRRARLRDQRDMFLATYVVQLALPDPRLYSAALTISGLTPFNAGTESLEYTTGAGADLAFDYPAGAGADLAFDYVGGSGTGTFAVVNSGTVPTFPSLTLTGPTAGSWSAARIANLTTGVDFELTNTAVGVGQYLVGDMYRAAGYQAGAPIVLGDQLLWHAASASRYAAWSQPRQPFFLAPGTNQLRLDVLAGDAAGVFALVWHRHAYL